LTTYNDANHFDVVFRDTCDVLLYDSIRFDSGVKQHATSADERNRAPTNS